MPRRTDGLFPVSVISRVGRYRVSTQFGEVFL